MFLVKLSIKFQRNNKKRKRKGTNLDKVRTIQIILSLSLRVVIVRIN